MNQLIVDIISHGVVFFYRRGDIINKQNLDQASHHYIPNLT